MIDLEAEYNNSAKVADPGAIIAGWGRDAAAFRAAHPAAELDIAYGPSPRQALDIFWPDAGRAAPLAMFLHGGYWQRLDRSFCSHLARGPVGRGVAVALPSYDLCPTVTLATLVEQVRDAAAFLARRHGGPLLASGHSAGGHLAAMLLATDWRERDLPADTVSAAYAISGLFDLAPLLHTTVNDAVRLDGAEARRLSPMRLPQPAGRFAAVVGGTEGSEYERQSREMAAAWGGTWRSAPGANHFDVVDPLAHPDSPMVAEMLSLLTMRS